MMGRWLCYILAAFLSLSLIAIGLVELLFRSQIKPKIERSRAAQERFAQPYLDDQVFLSRIGLLKEKKLGSSDAGVFLNPKVYWSPAPAGGATHALVPTEVRETLLRLRGDFLKKHARAKHMNADLSIFTGLSRFDYWDIESSGPIADLIAAHRFVPPPRLPVPETSDLLALVKLRLMLGALNGDFIASLSDVRQLALLMLTTENSQLVMAGLSALETERAAYRYFIEERGLAPASWVPIEQNVLRRAHRAVVATRAYLHLWTRIEILQKIFLPTISVSSTGTHVGNAATGSATATATTADAAPPGFCAAANEAFPLEYAVRPILEPRWPLEMSLRKEYETLDLIFKRARSECRLRYLTDLVDHEAFRINIPGPLILNRLPYSRKIFGLRVSTLNFTGLEAYANAPK